MIKLIILFLLCISLFAAYAGDNAELKKDSIDLARIVEEQIEYAREHPGRTSNIPDLLDEANLSGEFFAFIVRQYHLFTTLPAEWEIRILSGVMILLGITLLILILKLRKMKKETEILNNVKAVKQALLTGDERKVHSNPRIRKLLCAEPLSLLDKISANPAAISHAAKNLNVAKGEFFLATKIRSYQMGQSEESKNIFEFSGRREKI